MSLTIPELHKFLSINKNLCDFSSLNNEIQSSYNVTLEPVIFPSIQKTAKYLGNSQWKADFEITKQVLQTGDVVKLIHNNYKHVSKVVDINDSIFTLEDDVNNDVNEIYEVYGIQLFDVDRIALINYQNIMNNDDLSNKVITLDSTSLLNFNYELYKTLYPDSRALNQEDAYIEYIHNNRIGNIQELQNTEKHEPIKLPDDVTFDHVAIKSNLTLPSNICIHYATDDDNPERIIPPDQGLITEKAIKNYINQIIDTRESLTVTKHIDIPFSNNFVLPDETKLDVHDINVRSNIILPDNFYDQLSENYSDVKADTITIPSFNSIHFSKEEKINILDPINIYAPLTLDNKIVINDVDQLCFPNMSNITIDKDITFQSNVVLKDNVQLSKQGIDYKQVSNQIINPKLTTFCNNVLFDTKQVKFKNQTVFDSIEVKSNLILPPKYIYNALSNSSETLHIPSLYASKFDYPDKNLIDKIENLDSLYLKGNIKTPCLTVGRITSFNDPLHPSDPLIIDGIVSFINKPRFPTDTFKDIDITSKNINVNKINVNESIIVQEQSKFEIGKLTDFRINCKACFFEEPEFKTDVNFENNVRFSSNVFFDYNALFDKNLTVGNTITINSPQSIKYSDSNYSHNFCSNVYFSNDVTFLGNVYNYPVPDPDPNPKLDSITIKSNGLIVEDNKLDLNETTLITDSIVTNSIESEQSIFSNLYTSKINTSNINTSNINTEDINVTDKLTTDYAFLNKQLTSSEIQTEIIKASNVVTSNNKIQGLTKFDEVNCLGELHCESDATFNDSVTFVKNPKFENALYVEKGIVFPDECDFSDSLCTFNKWESVNSDFTFPSSIESFTINKDTVIDTSNIDFKHPININNDVYIDYNSVKIDWDDVEKFETPKDIPIVLNAPLNTEHSIKCRTIKITDDVELPSNVNVSNIDAQSGSFENVNLPSNLELSNVTMSSLKLNKLEIIDSIDMHNDLNISVVRSDKQFCKEGSCDTNTVKLQICSNSEVLDLDAQKIRVHQLKVLSNIVLPDPFKISSELHVKDSYFSNISVSDYALFSNAHFYESSHANANMYNLNVSNLDVKHITASNLDIQDKFTINEAFAKDFTTSNINAKTGFFSINNSEKSKIESLDVTEAIISNIKTKYADIDEVDVKVSTSENFKSKNIDISETANIDKLVNKNLEVTDSSYFEGVLHSCNMEVKSNVTENMKASSLTVDSNMEIKSKATFCNQIEIESDQGLVTKSNSPIVANGDATFQGSNTVFKGEHTEFQSNVDFSGESVSMDNGNVSITGPDNKAANLSITNASFSGDNVRFQSSPTFNSNANIQGKVVAPMIVIGRPNGVPVSNVSKETNVNMTHVKFLNDSSKTKVFSFENLEKQYNREVKLESFLYPNAVIQTRNNKEKKIVIHLVGAPFSLSMLGTRGEIIIQEKSMYGRTVELVPDTLHSHFFNTYEAPSQTGSYSINSLQYSIVNEHDVSVDIKHVSDYTPPEPIKDIEYHKNMFELYVSNIFDYNNFALSRGHDLNNNIDLPDSTTSTSSLEKAFLVNKKGDDDYVVRRLVLLNAPDNLAENDLYPEVYGNNYWSFNIPAQPSAVEIIDKQETLTTIEAPYHSRVVGSNTTPLFFIPLEEDDLKTRPTKKVSYLNPTKMLYTDGNELKELNNLTSSNVYVEDLNDVTKPYPKNQGVYLSDDYTKIILPQQAYVSSSSGHFSVIGGVLQLKNNDDYIVSSFCTSKPVIFHDVEGNINYIMDSSGAFVFKYSEDMAFQWVIYTSSNKVKTPNLLALPNGDFLVSWEKQVDNSVEIYDAKSNSFSFEGNMVIARYNAKGNFIWAINGDGLKDCKFCKETTDSYVSFAVRIVTENAYLKLQDNTMLNLSEEKDKSIMIHIDT